ncbi:selenoprotein K-like [Rhopilema esculentum]|uniref:selenoprotein K-like n=1 Tax=Rhopilema esculentum TaxID=499914 RepID=UPI0031E054DC
MVYISESGHLSESKSPWRISIIQDTFWGIINFIVLFFQTMFSPDLTKKGKGYESSNYKPGGGPPRPPGRRIGRIGGGGGGAGPGFAPPPGGG